MTFADAADYEVCRRLHRQYGTTYYFASRRFPPEVRRRVDALYGFVRVPDEWVDNPGTDSPEVVRARIRAFRAGLERGLAGERPDHPALRAFADTVRACGIPESEPALFLDAMESDIDTTRYASYRDLEHYMRGSAAAVGIMMVSILGAPMNPETTDAAKSLGDAMQLTNFLRDVGEDFARGRVYLPQDEMAAYGVSETDIAAGRVTPEFRALMKMQIERARALYAQADPAIDGLPPHARRAVRLARVLYSRILDRIEARDYDVFSGRARTSRAEKLLAAARLMLPERLAP